MVIIISSVLQNLELDFDTLKREQEDLVSFVQMGRLVSCFFVIIYVT